MVENGVGSQLDEVLGAILERERQFPTGIGYGVAVPHGKTPALSALVVVAGTTPAPVPYETIDGVRSEEHTSELQSLTNLVCRLLLEKKKNKTNNTQDLHERKVSRTEQ